MLESGVSILARMVGSYTVGCLRLLVPRHTILVVPCRQSNYGSGPRNRTSRLNYFYWNQIPKKETREGYNSIMGTNLSSPWLSKNKQQRPSYLQSIVCLNLGTEHFESALPLIHVKQTILFLSSTDEEVSTWRWTTERLEMKVKCLIVQCLRDQVHKLPFRVP
jgi:hypothetical protein